MPVLPLREFRFLVMFLLLKNLLFTVVVPGSVAVYVPLWIVRGQLAGSGISVVISSGLFAIGAGIYCWCLWDFATFGRGTPAPIDAPRKLVIRGLYRHIRNPMYVGVLCILLGWIVLFKSRSLLNYTLGTGLCLHLLVVFYEEPHLKKLFGISYNDYLTQVGRWLPKIGRSKRYKR